MLVDLFFTDIAILLDLVLRTMIESNRINSTDFLLSPERINE